MKTLFAIFPAIAFLAGQFVLAQANIDMPGSRKDQPSNTAKESSPGCRPEPTINSKGELELKDCSGNTKRVERSAFDKNAAPAASTGQPQASSSADLDPATQAEQQKALRAKFDYQAYRYFHTKRTFDFQYWSGKIIFWVVLLIVFSGLVLSALQFYVGLRHPLETRLKGDAGATAPDDASVSEFEVSLQRIKLKSSVLGLLILAFSLVFFYLYLKYVYPITNISQ